MGRGRADREAVQQLHHQPGEPLEGPGYPDRRRHLDQNTLGRVDVDLKPAGLVDRGVDERQQALKGTMLARAEWRRKEVGGRIDGARGGGKPDV